MLTPPPPPPPVESALNSGLPQSLKSMVLMKCVLPPGESSTHLSIGGWSADNDGRQTIGLTSQAAEQLHVIGLFHRSLTPYNKHVTV